MADKRVVIDQCLSSTKGLRASVSQIFEDFVSKPVAKVDGESSDAAKSSEFVTNSKKNFVNVQKSISNLEKSAAQVSQMKADSGVTALGNTGLLGLDLGEDKTPLYRELLGTYNWHEKLYSQSMQAVSCLKRNHPCSIKRNDDFTKKVRYPITTPKSDFERLEKLLQFLRQKHSSLHLIVTRPSGAFVLEVTVPKTFKAIIVLRGFGIDQVIIRGINETTLNEQKGDVWTPSQHAVYRKLTDYATSAVLHYYSTSDLVLQIVSFLRWLDSFQSLFSRKCTKCGLHLQEDQTSSPLPPCWRAYDTLQPYHYKCFIKP